MRIRFPEAFLLAGMLIPGALPTRAAPVDAYQARTFKLSATKSLPYRLFIPKNYDASKAYPVILTLHGAGERGNDNRSQLNHLFTNMWADDSIQKENPCFVIAPQCPANEWWVVSPTFGDYKYEQAPVTDNLKSAIGILDAVEKEFHIDLDRQYIMGMSMGGAGTWYSLVYAADRFAAAVPVCGGGDTSKAKIFDRTPIWTFHEVDDPTVPVAFTRHLASAIRAVGGKRFKYTEYPASLGYGHESWKPAGKDPELHRWLFAQAKTAATAIRIAPAQGPTRIATSKAFPGAILFTQGDRPRDGLGRSFPLGAK